jgi:hypothetical protein
MLAFITEFLFIAGDVLFIIGFVISLRGSPETSRKVAINGIGLMLIAIGCRTIFKW